MPEKSIDSSIKLLSEFNQWRRGADLPQPNPKEIGEAIDRVLSELHNRPRIGQHITIEQLELAHIKAIVAKTTTLDEATRILGIDIATLYRKRRKHGMEMRG